MEMETGAGHQQGGGEVHTNLGVLLEGAGVTLPPVNGKSNGNGGGQPTVSDDAAATETEAAVPQNGGAGTSETVVAETAPDPNAKFVFRTWLLLNVFVVLKRFLKTVDPVVLFEDGSGPDKGRDSEKIHGAWKKLKKLHAACKSNAEAWRTLLVGIVSGVEQKIGNIETVFTFLEGKKIVHSFRDICYGLAWALNVDDRVEVVNIIRGLDRDRAWFGDPDTVRANYEEFLEENRRREEARERRVAERAAEEARIEGFADIGDLLTIAEGAGIELTSVVSKEAIIAAQARLPEVGDVLESKVDQLMTVQNDESKTYISGIRFERIAGRKEQPFLPARFIQDRWRRLEDETISDYEQRLKASMASGVLLRVEKVEKDDRGYSRVLVQIRTVEEIAAIRDHGRHIPFVRPTRKLEEGESKTGRVIRRSDHGVQVEIHGGIRLFCHTSNIAEGLSLEVGDDVYGVVIPGHGDREFDFAIRERVVEEYEGEEASPEHIIHPARVEEIREFVVERGISLTDEQQGFLHSCDERARKLVVLTTDDEIEVIHAFFREVLKDADRRFESVVMTLRDYRREQEDAAEESHGEADIRPFCANHEAEDGQSRCDRRVAVEGALCVRCQKSVAGRPSRPGAKKRGVKGKHKKG